MAAENFVTNIPVLFHPTQIVMIDDHTNFLNMLEGFLMLDRAFVKFSTPKEAIDYITTYDQKFNPKHFFNATFETLHQYLQEKHRFLQLATIFCDYNMPVSSGTDILNTINETTHYPYKRVLLTGVNRDQLQKNEKLENIERILFKDKLSTDVSSFLPLVIELENEFFADVYNQNVVLPLLQEPDFLQAFNQLVAKHNIIEGYLIENGQCFILIDRDGHLFKLPVHDHHQLDIENITDTLNSSIYSYENYITKILS